jgi:hypothetical protein
MIISTQNNDSLVVHEHLLKSSVKVIDPKKAVWAEIQLKNGNLRKQEFYYGTSFISQSSRKLEVPDYVKTVVFHDGEENINVTEAQ